MSGSGQTTWGVSTEVLSTDPYPCASWGTGTLRHPASRQKGLQEEGPAPRGAPAQDSPEQILNRVPKDPQKRCLEGAF